MHFTFNQISSWIYTIAGSLRFRLKKNSRIFSRYFFHKIPFFPEIPFEIPVNLKKNSIKTLHILIYYLSLAMCKTIRINRNINSNKKKEKPGEKRIKLSVEYFEKTPFIEKKHIMYIYLTDSSVPCITLDHLKFLYFYI